MEVRTEKIRIEATGYLYLPQWPTASLPTASSHKGLLVYDTNANKLKFSNGTTWETVTSS